MEQTIQMLIARFYNAETSAAEEDALRRWAFGDGRDEAEAAALRALLGEAVDEPAGLEERLAARLDTKEGGSRFALDWRKAVMGAAAAVVVALLIGVGMRRTEPTLQQTIAVEDVQPDADDTFRDPQQAYEATKEALAFASRTYRKNLDETRATLDRVQQKLKGVRK